MNHERRAHGGTTYWLCRIASICGLAFYMTDPVVPPCDATLVCTYCGLSHAATADD